MKGKRKRILVVVVKWRHRANGLLAKVCDWLNTHNKRQEVYCNFSSLQKGKMDYLINIQICHNNTQTSTTSERKNYTKFVGILLDSNLSWKYHFDYAASKIK